LEQSIAPAADAELKLGADGEAAEGTAAGLEQFVSPDTDAETVEPVTDATGGVALISVEVTAASID
jgi:hypothetical protein